MRLIPPTILQKFLPLFKKRSGQIRPTDFVWSGLVALVILFAAMALWGGYFFYSRVVVPPESGYEISGKRSVEIGAGDVDEIITILDERQKKFDEILGQ